jgi:tryptophan-rich hypothetical protein
MNQINPKKLLHSKWTSMSPKQKELHFIVTKLSLSEDNVVLECEIEAVINHKRYSIDWHELKQSEKWKIGWK